MVSKDEKSASAFLILFFISDQYLGGCSHRCFISFGCDHHTSCFVESVLSVQVSYNTFHYKHIYSQEHLVKFFIIELFFVHAVFDTYIILPLHRMYIYLMHRHSLHYFLFQARERS